MHNDVRVSDVQGKTNYFGLLRVFINMRALLLAVKYKRCYYLNLEKIRRKFFQHYLPSCNIFSPLQSEHIAMLHYSHGYQWERRIHSLPLQLQPEMKIKFILPWLSTTRLNLEEQFSYFYHFPLPVLGSFTPCTFDSQLLPLTAKHFRSNINKSLVHFTLLSWTFHFPILPLLYPIPFLFPFSPLPYQAHSTLIIKKEFWW